MPTLDEFNAQRLLGHLREHTYPRPNGITCPKCGAELADSDGLLRLSNPIQRKVQCTQCDFHGYRYV